MKRVTPFRLSQKKALAIVRETVSDSWRVIISDHARKRMRQRRILRTQVDRCLMFGHIIEGPTSNDQGRWVTVVTTYRGD